ncbi:MAG: hypothetical protein LBL21_02370 [Rickettsiales bacterium]|jgi:hypothetical protein|nr:hypothetical protein [Rickettsiales bacterium]
MSIKLPCDFGMSQKTVRNKVREDFDDIARMTAELDAERNMDDGPVTAEDRRAADDAQKAVRRLLALAGHYPVLVRNYRHISGAIFEMLFTLLEWCGKHGVSPDFVKTFLEKETIDREELLELTRLHRKRVNNEMREKARSRQTAQ